MKRLILQTSVVLLSFASAAADVTVEAGGETFVIREKQGQLFRQGGKRLEPVFSRNMRIMGPKGVAAVSPDGREAALTVVEDTSARTVVRGEFSLASHAYTVKGEKPEPFDAAKLTVEYVFRKDLAGVVAVETLTALKPFQYESWNIPLGAGFTRFSTDGKEMRPYPTQKEFRALPGGYRTLAGAYLEAEEPNGARWWFGREFGVFCPHGDGKPGGFYACPHGKSAGRHAMAAGDTMKLCVSAGLVKSSGDVGRLRALRNGGNALAVADFTGDWRTMPVAAWRGETVDYRPKAGLNWEGRNDLSFTLRLGKDAEGVRVRVEVTDDLVRNTFAGQDVALGDSVHVVFTDGSAALDKVVSALSAKRVAGGYEAEIPVSWKELSAKGLSREKGIRFNLCVADQDKGSSYDNWMGVADGVMGGRDLSLAVPLDFSGVVTDFVPEQPVLPSHEELAKKIEAVAAMNAKLPDASGDAYTDCLKAMTDYFLAFMRTDLDAKDEIAFGHQTRKIDETYRYYMDDRINRNADYLIVLQRELARRQADLASGAVKPMKLVDYAKGVRPVIADGGFKVDGKELLLIGPDTWTNVKGWRNDDVEWIGRTGFNQLNCFYIGGTNYADVVRRCEEQGLYCVWGSAHDSDDDLTKPKPEWTVERQNAHRNGMGYWMGSLVPSNPSPMFAFQVGFPEQWTRKYEATEDWAKEFRAHLEGKFGSLAALNAALGSDYASWTNVDFAAALRFPPLKYESFVFRMERNLRHEVGQQKWLERRFGLPRSVHYSTHYNLCGLDPLVVLADFEALWSIFDIVGFDGGFGLEGSEYAIDFAKGGFEIDLSRSFYPRKPIANNENHIISDGLYREYSNEETYLSNILSYLMGMNSGSIWDWANTRHTYGEYAFTKANTYHETIRCALDLRRFPEEIGALRNCPNPPFRILHSLPSLQERDPYVRSLYGLYGASSFTGWAVRFLSERNLKRDDFKCAKVVIVPDARYASDETFDALVRFADRGGTVLVDGEEALAKDTWGKSVPARAAMIARKFRRYADTGTATRFDALNAALREKGVKPPVAVTTADGKAPFGVMWRNAVTPAGEKVAFLANLGRAPVDVKIAGRWQELLNGRDLGGTVGLKSMDVLLIKER